jgi:hypothetical protein
MAPPVCGKFARSKEPVVLNTLFLELRKLMSEGGGDYVRNCKRGLMFVKLRSPKCTEWTVRRFGAFQ